MVQKGLNLVLRWRDSPWARTVAEAVRGPGALTVGLCIFYYLSRSYLGLSGPIESVLAPLYVAIVTACLVWFLQRLIRLITALIMRRYAGYDSDEANVLITWIAITRHLLMLLVVIGGATYALSKFELVRRFGMMTLASAGVPGLVLGIAAHRVLGNLFAGFLLGIVQPVKAGDALIFENEFGWIEEITTTHLVIRTWDQRRWSSPSPTSWTTRSRTGRGARRRSPSPWCSTPTTAPISKRSGPSSGRSWRAPICGTGRCRRSSR